MTSGKKLRILIISAVSVILLVVVGLFLVRAAIDAYYRAEYPLKYVETINKYAEQYEVDPYLVIAVVKTESGFDPGAESNVGARGLMQIMPETFDWIHNLLGEGTDSSVTFDDLYDPEIAVKYGTRMLAALLERFGSVDVALASYHGGWGNVVKWLSDPAYSTDGETLETTPIEQTNHYISKVNKAMDKYKELYGEDGLNIPIKE